MHLFDQRRFGPILGSVSTLEFAPYIFALPIIYPLFITDIIVRNAIFYLKSLTEKRWNHRWLHEAVSSFHPRPHQGTSSSFLLGWTYTSVASYVFVRCFFTADAKCVPRSCVKEEWKKCSSSRVELLLISTGFHHLLSQSKRRRGSMLSGEKTMNSSWRKPHTKILRFNLRF